MNRFFRTKSLLAWANLVVLLISVGFGAAAQASDRHAIDARVNSALANFTHEVKGASGLLKSAKGVLVFAGVIKAGIGIGGEYGEGALRMNGKTAGYYNIAAASIGFQLGAQKKDVILLFMQDEALANFRNSDGWKVGVDGSVAVVKIGAGGEADTNTIKAPILAFIVGQKGLMYNLTLEGSKISRLER